MQWYVWLIVLGVLVIFYVLIGVRQKRQQKQSEQILNSFKVGDKVVTHIGIYGKIKKINNTTYGKVCVLEIGTTNKVDVELDMRYIAGIDEKTAAPEEQKTEETSAEEVSAEPKNKTKNK